MFGPWWCSAQQPGTVTHPEQLVVAPSDWLPAIVPGTVAAALQENGCWDFDHPAEIDARDWWYRTSFTAPDWAAGRGCQLCFDGLATLAEVWLNGERVLQTENMFRSYAVEISSLLRPENELVIGFRSLTADLQQKRRRPRWKTKLVAQQQLRWRRTSLQGRIPGWSSAAPAIGPWRAVRLEPARPAVGPVRISSRLEGTVGMVSIQARLAGDAAERASLRVGDAEYPLDIHTDSAGKYLQGTVRISQPPLWWPHTHGQPALVACELILESRAEQRRVACPAIGFRSLEIEDGCGFGLKINGEPIYCRGACWTVSDCLTLAGTAATLRHDLELARDAGVNLLRVGGTMVYESDLFYRLCDELGILVWQDFMFANMDYPVEEPGFRNEIRIEATEQLQRLASHPCVAVYCGNSEVAQQAAMLGMPRELWHHDWFAEELPALCAAEHPGTAYLPSTPSGGILPFHANTGVTHYYGVGAYLRSPAELRQTNVKFTPECLGFANIPDSSTLESLVPGTSLVSHDPRWKRRVPRDSGAGWDFEDVRDHYLRELYGVDPVVLRSRNFQRYLQLSRMASAEMMSQVFSEWRGTHSGNRGGLVWFYKDLLPGAGWGIVDACGRPKAAYYALKRIWNSRQLTLTDEGLNGLHLHLTNELSEPLEGVLEVLLLKEPQTVIARQEIGVRLPPRGQQRHSADEILGGFYDVSYAYRFGPPHHDVVIATLFDADRRAISEAVHFISHREPYPAGSSPLESRAERIDGNLVRVTIRSGEFLHGVSLQAPGYLPDDNYFHLAPGRERQVTFRPWGTGVNSFRAELDALNLNAPHGISLGPSSPPAGGGTCS